MLLVTAMAVVLATAVIAGGRLTRLLDLEIRGRWLLFLSLVIQVLAISVFPYADESVLATVHVGSYALAGAVVSVNRKTPGVMVIGLGGLLNLTAIIANGGVMPASRHALARAGLSSATDAFANSRALVDPNVPFLGDVFAIPESWPVHNVFSFGDVLIVLGLTILLHAASETRVASFFARRGRVLAGSVWGCLAGSPSGSAPTSPSTSRPERTGRRACFSATTAGTRPRSHSPSSPTRGRRSFLT